MAVMYDLIPAKSTSQFEFFKRQSIIRRANADRLCIRSSELLFKPHLNSRYQAYTLIYPVFHIFELVNSSLLLFKGLFLLTNSLFDNPRQNTGIILDGLVNNLITTLINIINLVFSLVSIISRNVMTLVNLGYRDESKSEFLNSFDKQLSESTLDMQDLCFNYELMTSEEINRAILEEYITLSSSGP